jgi:hypothetical protein
MRPSPLSSIILCSGLLLGCRSAALSGFSDLGGSGDLANPEHDLALPRDLAFGPRSEPSPTTEELLGVWGSASNDIYAAGRGGTILHSRGDGAWTAQTSGTTEDLYAIWGSGPNDIYIAGMQDVLHSTGDGTWTVQSTPSPGNLGVWGSGPHDLYAGGLFALAHSTGDGTWTRIPASESEAGYFCISGRGPNDVWAVGGNANGLGMGSGGYEHFDGSWSWKAVEQKWNMKAVAFTAAGTFLVGNGGLVYADRGQGFVAEPSPVPDDLNAVWASTDGVLFAAGGSGVFLRSSGNGAWTSLSTPSALPLDAVWGSSANDVYAVGFAGEIVHAH